jgi:hypothetical protein
MSFEELWNKFAVPRNGGPVSPNLRPLLEKTYQEILQEPPNLMAVKAALEELLLFLTTSEGRTNPNIYATDLFFCLCDDWGENLEHLPESFTEILGDIGGAMHDTIAYPEIAKNFEGLPEQLLERVKRLDVSQ